VQGESGVKPADLAFLEAARRLCDEHGALLIFDEIQCGMGRLGTLFAFQTFGVRPEVITLAKSLANGLPIGAVLIDAGAASALQPGDHGTTFGGSPVPCAAALAHLKVRASFNIDEHVKAVGATFFAGLRKLHEQHPEMFGEPRGTGLMLGLPVREPYEAKTIVDQARTNEHVLFNAAGDNTLRFVPPLILSQSQATTALDALTRIVDSWRGSTPPA
jgi:acetylornithine/succinyldiaminopimelate/putrescine aminotransferase